MNKTTAGMTIIALFLSITAFFRGGIHLVFSGVLEGAKTIISIFPILIVAFLVAGLISTLVTKEMATKWLGHEAGWKGPFFGSMMGALVPGGPFFFYPLMATLLTSGASLGTMMSFVAAKTLWNVARLPIEIAFVGLELTLIRIVVTFMFPIIVGTLINLILPGFEEKIRSDIQSLQLKRRPEKAGEKND